MIVIFSQAVDGLRKTRAILRRGNGVVQFAFVAETNHRNEYGRPLVERRHPFVSSSSLVLQAALQCNSGIQSLGRAVPCQDAAAAIACDADGGST